MKTKPEKQDKHEFPVHMWSDIITRNENIDAGRELCERCDGTGNEFYSMYSPCKDCNGTGHK